MKTVAVISQKGGAGKTTLTVHVATAANGAGFPAAILDMDNQGTAEAWGAWRERGTGEAVPPVFAAKVPSLPRLLERVKEAGAAIAVIDTPPLAQGEAMEAAQLADLILIPCRPAGFDLHAIRLTANLAKTVRTPAYAVFNGGPPRDNATVYAESAKLIETYKLAVAPVRLSDRAVFRQAVGSGQTAAEIDPAGKAAQEVEAMWAWIKKTAKVK